MKKNLPLAVALLALAAVAPGLAAPASASPYATRSRVDWKGRVLSLEVELDLGAAGLRLPGARLAAERMVERDVAGLARAESASFSKDLRFFLATYTLRLDAVASLFLSGASPSPIRAPLEARPTRAYSGIVIYAKGSLPVHGESVEGVAAPCLFPRVYDSEMNLVLDRSLVLPEALAEGGALGYAESIGVEAGERVGSDPMRVMAVELFGDARTDFVIPREDALRILATPGNRELLRQGRVVVVY